MLKKILFAMAAVLILLVVVIATRPATFHVERSVTIAAPAPIIFAFINDFHHWAAWSPWEKLDPEMKRTFDGPARGTGAMYAWVGNDQVGEGRMTIMQSRPHESVTIQLDFIKPWEGSNKANFILQDAGPQGTKLTWTMEGNNNFVAKAFSLVADVDAWVGKDFEAGLTRLKEISEKEATAAAAAP